MTRSPGHGTGENRIAGYTVLGATGFVGSRLVNMLNSTCGGCYAPSRGDSEVFRRDLGRVFYCIGLTADYAHVPFATVEAHVTFLSRVLSEARFERLVYLSSTRLYDDLPPGPCGEDVCLQFSVTSPRHIYDLSKALGENICMTASGDRASVARLSCVYDHTTGSPGFLSQLLQRIPIEREFVLDSSSGVVRDYVAINDVVVALKLILDRGENQIFNVASGENVSNQEIVDTLNTHGWHISLSRLSEREDQVVCDISKLKALGVEPSLVRDNMDSFIRNLRGFHAPC